MQTPEAAAHTLQQLRDLRVAFDRLKVQRLHMLMWSFSEDCWVVDRDAGLADPEDWGGVGWPDA